MLTKQKTNHPRIEQARRRTMLVALPLASLLCALATIIVITQPNYGPLEIAIMPISGLLFLAMFITYLRAPVAAPRLVAYAMGLAFALIWMRIFLMVSGPLYLDEERSVFTGIYAYIPLFYLWMFLLTSSRTAVVSSLGAWVILCSTLGWFTWPMFQDNIIREGLLHLWLYMLIGQPAFIILLSILPGYEQVVSNLNVRLDEAARSRDRMRYAATHDHLTGLVNRQTFEKRLERIWSDRRETEHGAGLIVIDVDNFKQVNDTQGHQAGDDCLKWIADLISDSLRADDIASRFGGDEFAVLLPKLDLNGTHSVAERIRERVEQEGDNRSLPTLSLGITSFVPNDERTPQMIFADADRALYSAKNSGRNHVA